MAKRISFFVLAALVWLLVTWTLEYQSLVVGFGLVLLSTVVFGGYFIEAPPRYLQPHRYLWALAYIPVFIYYVIKANVDVAFRVLHPLKPLNPGIVRIHTGLKTDVAKTFLADSITLTPGTMTVEIVGDALYIHWIDVRSQDVADATRLIVGPFERFLKRIFE